MTSRYQSTYLFMNVLHQDYISRDELTVQRECHIGRGNAGADMLCTSPLMTT
jgi:hypothetical protein